MLFCVDKTPSGNFKVGKAYTSKFPPTPTSYVVTDEDGVDHDILDAKSYALPNCWHLEYDDQVLIKQVHDTIRSNLSNFIGQKMGPDTIACVKHAILRTLYSFAPEVNPPIFDVVQSASDPNMVNMAFDKESFDKYIQQLAKLKT